LKNLRNQLEVAQEDFERINSLSGEEVSKSAMGERKGGKTTGNSLAQRSSF
jgi:hypothetical protein